MYHNSHTNVPRFGRLYMILLVNGTGGGYSGPLPGSGNSPGGGCPIYIDCIDDNMDGGGGNGNQNNPDAIGVECEVASVSVTNANNTLHDITVKTKMDDVLKSKINASNEFAVSIGKNSDGTFSISNPKEGGITSGSVPAVTSGNYYGDGHSHAGGKADPSAGDFYEMLGTMFSNPYFEVKYVYGNDFGTPEVYALIVHDSGLVAAFLANYPKSSNYDPATHTFQRGSPVGTEFFNIKELATAGTYINSGDQYGSSAIGLAYILEKFNTSISLAKLDANGNLKKINISQEPIVVPGGNGIPKNGLNISKCP